MAAYGEFAVFAFQNFLSVGHLRETELLGYLRTYLCRVAVDGLATTDNHIGTANLLDGCGQGVRGGQRVGTGKESVSKQPACVCTAVKTLSDDFCSTGRTHGQDAHGRTGVLFFQAQCLFQGIQVFGVKDCGQCGTVNCAFGGHRVFTHIPCVGYLLGKYDDFQTHSLCFIMILIS